MQVSGAGSTQQLDLSALAALSRQGEVPAGQELMGTINADDLVASVHSKSSPGNNSLVGEKNVDRQAGSADRSGGQHKQKILVVCCRSSTDRRRDNIAQNCTEHNLRIADNTFK